LRDLNVTGVGSIFLSQLRSDSRWFRKFEARSGFSVLEPPHRITWLFVSSDAAREKVVVRRPFAAHEDARLMLRINAEVQVY
jgi:hypothetical protein